MSNIDLFTYSDAFEDPFIKKEFNELSNKNNPKITSRILFDLIDEMAGVYSKKEIILSIKENFRLLKSGNLNNIYYNKNNLEIKPNYNKRSFHQESVFEYYIIKNNIVVGTFGFYITCDGKRNVLHVSNIQGVRKDSLPLNIYEIINKELKENWRVFVLKELVSFASKNKFGIILELPKKAQVSRGEYIRQLRQYFQTAEKAGLKITQISSKRINDVEIKNKFMEYTINKIKEEKKFKKVFVKEKDKNKFFKKKKITRK